jgi:penicillin-binding protein 1A
VLENFQTTMKQVISEQAAFTMARMMQGPVDFGTAKGLRGRLGALEMGGKTGTTNDRADAWFLGYTPQLLAGAWIGCDARFIHLESGLGDGGRAAAPIWEAFFQKVYADKTLGIDKNARFVQPENMNNQQNMDYSPLTDLTLPPGAEGADQGNGGASGYEINFEKDTSHVPVESILTPEEKKILKDAANPNRKEEVKPTQKQATEPEKKRKNIFQRIFGGKEKRPN